MEGTPAKQEAGGNLCRTKDAVQCRIEQVVAHHGEARVRDRFRLVGGRRVAQGRAAGHAAQCASPPMHSPFDDARTGLALERTRERANDPFDERVISETAQGERVGPSQEPAQDPMSAGGAVGARLVVDATAAECVEHEPRSVELFPPEPPVEQHRDAQVMCRMIVVGHVSRHGVLQAFSGPFDPSQLRVRQRDNDSVEALAAPDSTGAGVDPVSSVARSR
jgi:hypothetical protein